MLAFSRDIYIYISNIENRQPVNIINKEYTYYIAEIHQKWI